MIAASIAFSLFTAYQFLSSNELVSDHERKIRPYPSWVNQRLCACMMEMIATSSKQTAKRAWQSPSLELQYNTCRRRTRQFSAIGCLIIPDNMFIIFRCEVDHMLRLVCFISALYVFIRFSWRFSSLPAKQFLSASTTPKSWPHINHSVLGFDHIFDHKQIRSTRRQECTRVWKSRFCVAERARKSKNG